MRLSGPRARELVDSIFRGKTQLAKSPPRTMKHGYIVDESEERLDEVLAVWFCPPYSYTGEEAAEIQCHGGSLAAKRCLELLLDRGARLAEPGEFTKRAFLSGRIDLSQAEAVLGIIKAKSDEALRAAARSLSGEISREVEIVYDALIALSAEVEVVLDFPEEDVPPKTDLEILQDTASIASKLEALISRCQVGFALREGVRVAIAGRPNVGKSSLLNALSSRERAIVTPIPGTTRDVIEEVIVHKGLPVRLTDMAGLRKPQDELEAIGVDRAKATIDGADILVIVLDASAPLTDDDREIAANTGNAPRIVALNKVDLPLAVAEGDVRALFPNSPICSTSALLGFGIEGLKDAIFNIISKDNSFEAGLNASARELFELQCAARTIAEAQEAIKAGLGQDLAASALATAGACLQRLLGKSYDDALLEAIFSRFCVGK